ncbi:phosphate ABC transporter ATP-binding protein [Thermococcus waiotapuensis]|uniref:Phosphate ABC transporter ATP-binding protein n=1 Tax=Thermococcus waiotapuensis TaxID=90909 RepID=A0AAE4NU15_9EURY|nr:phosphate ABC transporter ATP-binding protein [Thermococcus waiotapuensis]MDV3103645.1 phosphate ABC transporter ATP-binding protein [Thermococcus waiotapuensis]
MKFAIETKNLHVYYGKNHVITGVDLQIPEKGVFALMGPSGCGKSTMLRTFNRLIELNDEARVEGEVLLFGENIYGKDVDPMDVRKRVGMVFQYPNPFPHLTIYDNVAIGPKLNRMVSSKEELDKRVEWALRKAALWDEVKDRLNDYPSNLSGGQMQRLVIARALAMKPEVLLMDEPTANIDPVGTVKIEELLFELKNDYTIVLVTHSPAQAARVSDYVAFLYLGKLIEVGPTKKVFENPEHELTEKYVTGALG